MPGYTGSLPITGFIAPTDTLDTYPVFDPLFGIDGLRNVPDLTALNAIPNDRRRAGMVVGVQSTNQYYRLLSSPWTGSITDWTDFITAPAAGNVTRTQYLITQATVSIPANYQYFVYGGLIIATAGVLQNNGQVVIMNGTMSIVSGGSYSGTGQVLYINDLYKLNSTYPYDGSGSGPSMSVPNVKYAASFSSSASVPITITHSLNTTDITYSVRENNNFITANVEISTANSVILTTNADVINGRINIIG